MFQQEHLGLTDMLDLNTLPKTRKEALQIGSTFYFTGKPCKNGHVSKRYAKHGGTCVKCHKEYQKEYQKTDAYKEYQKEYQKTDAYKESLKKYRQTDAYKEYQKQYNQTDARKESQKKYRQTDAYKGYRKHTAKIFGTNMANECYKIMLDEGL